MQSSNNYSFKVLLLSPYPDNIKKSIESYGDTVDVLNTKIDNNLIKKNSYDFIISFGYKFILEKKTIDAVNRSAINLHISYLPFNRGAHPNLWSNIENTISGVTIHLLDEGIDTGNILFQKEIYIDEYLHSFKSSYDLLISEIENLFKINWKYIRINKFNSMEQEGQGSFHYAHDFERVRPFLKKGWDTNINELKSNFLKSNDSN